MVVQEKKRVKQRRNPGEELYGMDTMLSDAELILLYKQEVSQKSIHAVLDFTELHFSRIQAEKAILKTINSIAIECLQNIIKHGSSVTTSARRKVKFPLFAIGKSGASYSIVTGNFVSNGCISSFEQRLNRINQLDRTGLQEYYIQTISNPDTTDIGKAGLGLIDIARRAGSGIEYNFKPFNQECSYFTMKVSIHPSN